MFSILLTQTITSAFRKGGGAFGALAFYLIVIALFVFALGPEGLARYGGAAMCVAFVLASMIALPLLYDSDDGDGMLEQLVLRPTPLEWLVLAKITGYFIAAFVPMLAVSPLVALMAGISAETSGQTWLALALAAPTIAAIGSLAAALTLGHRRGGLLQALIALPLYIPVLIFAAAGGQGGLLFLAALLMAVLPLSCLISAALIRLSVE